MFRSQKINLLFLFCLVLLSSLDFAQRTDCDFFDRPTAADCAAQPTEPTCAYYRDDCPLDLCGKPATNPCAACRLPDVNSYERKECDLDVIVATCSESTCDTTLPSWRINGFIPACGLDDETDNDDISDRETFESACALCRDGDFEVYHVGPCRKDRFYCDESDASDNSDFNSDNTDLTDNTSDSDDNSVCAYFTTPDVGSVSTTVSSGPEACSDEAVEYWTGRECGPSFGNVTYCLPNTRPQECTEENAPVCGFYKDADGRIAHKVVSNACSACADPTVLYHVPGSCVLSCDIPLDLENCDGWISPVCGTYDENGVERQVSLRNACIGCSLPDKEILSFTDGLCAGDLGIRCENDRDIPIEGSSSPVCGYTTEDCNSDACRQTYAGPRVACAATSVIWYSPGACAGDE